jgi:uncharacterized alkaline shock family protein YloU
MRFLERTTLKIFSIIMLFISITMLLIVFEIIPTTFYSNGVTFLMDDTIYRRITIGVCVVSILLALKCIFSKLKPVDVTKNGIILENANGKLVISRESLENLINGIAKEMPGAENASSRILLDSDKNLVININLTVLGNVVIKEITVELQKRVKEALRRTADLEVRLVNVNIKNINSKKTKMKKNEEGPSYLLKEDESIVDSAKDKKVEDVETKEAVNEEPPKSESSEK